MTRRIKKIEYSRKFLKSLKKLPENTIGQAANKERIFMENCFDPRLGVHKLHGKEKGHWAFWINHAYRIKFLFLPGEEVLFLDVGTHEIYK